MPRPSGYPLGMHRPIFSSLIPLLMGLMACASPPPAPPPLPTGPYLVLLGTAQDGGYPQMGCQLPLCQDARQNPELARHVVSALLVDPRCNQRWLLDASPDLPEQLEVARSHAAPPALVGSRPPLFDGIFITHGHMGHYTGLMHLGREAYGTQTTRLYASQKMGAYLKHNGPWSLLFEASHLKHEVLRAGRSLALRPDLILTPLSVPHRGEFSDTFAFAIQGPERSLLYLPDIDRWQGEWAPLQEWLEEYDEVLVDGTFYDGAELPGRDMSQIPHPPISHTLDLLEELPAPLRAKVNFLHINHTNPVLDPNSSAAARVREVGARVCDDGDRFDL